MGAEHPLLSTAPTVGTEALPPLRFYHAGPASTPPGCLQHSRVVALMSDPAVVLYRRVIAEQACRLVATLGFEDVLFLATLF